MYDLVVKGCIGETKTCIYWNTEKEQICQTIPI